MSTHTRKPVRHAPAAAETDASKVSYYASRSLAPAGSSLYGAKAARTPHAPDSHDHVHTHDTEMPPVPQNGRNAKSIDMVSRTTNHHSDKDKDSKPAVKDSHSQTEESLAKTTAHSEAKKRGAATTQSAAHAAVLNSAAHEKAHH